MIVGQGLAGTLLSYFLLQAGKEIIVIDEEKEHTASKICGGMFTPVSGKRMVKGKNTDEQIAFLKETFTGLERFLGVRLLNETAIYTVLGSVKEQNDLSLKTDDPDFARHINLHPEWQEHVRQPFGAFEVSGSGWINISLLLEKFREKLIERRCFVSGKFDHALLSYENNQWNYAGKVADTIIFCEGAQAADNPFFPNLPFRFCKGDILTIRCDQLKTKRVIKKGIGILHLHDNLFRAGSTYEWNDLSELPTENGKKTLEKKLDDLLDVPYTIVSHKAAIRPSTRTRDPIILQHPKYNRMFLLNGLGTKGVMNGPWSVHKLLPKLL
jgi:glycine/D-amino acid oxidase-like deaminating enzyme